MLLTCNLVDTSKNGRTDSTTYMELVATQRFTKSGEKTDSTSGGVPPPRPPKPTNINVSSGANYLNLTPTKNV